MLFMGFSLSIFRPEVGFPDFPSVAANEKSLIANKIMHSFSRLHFLGDL